MLSPFQFGRDVRRKAARLGTAALVSFVCQSSVFSQSAGFSFLKSSPSPSLNATASSNLVDASDPFSVWANPAASARGQKIQVAFSYRRWVEGMNSGFLGAGFGIGGWRVATVFAASSVTDIPIRPLPGDPVGTFDQHDMALTVAASGQFSERLSLGVGLTGLYEQIYVDDVTLLTGSIGGVYSLPSAGIDIAASVTHLGKGTSFRSETTKPPTTVAIGLARGFDLPQLSGSAALSASIVKSVGEDGVHVRGGGSLDFAGAVTVRAGYESGYDSRGLTFGLGLRYRGLRLDYAFVPFRDGVGDMNWFGVQLSFSTSDEE